MRLSGRFHPGTDLRRARAASGMFPRRAGVASGTCTTSATPCCSTPRARMPKARWVVWCRRPGESRTTCSMRFGLRRSVPTIRCARSMSPATAWKSAGCTVPLVTAARSLRRPLARCGTSTWTGRWRCRRYTRRVLRSSALPERGACRQRPGNGRCAVR